MAKMGGTKAQTMISKPLQRKLKIEQTKPNKYYGVISDTPDEMIVPAPLLPTVVLLLLQTRITN